MSQDGADFSSPMPAMDMIMAEALYRTKLRQEKNPRLHYEPLPHQFPPDPNNDEWDTWMLLGGRGSGKTRAGVEYVIRHLRSEKENARVGVGAPTVADARDTCAEGDSGLITLYGHEFKYNRSLGEAWHKDGGYVKFQGSEKPGRWNGPQWTLLWADELALWREDSWDQAQFGLRIGRHPRCLVTTTPKNRVFVKELSKDAATIISRATTRDNPHLSPIAVRKLMTKYGGTRLGRQEIEAEFVEDVEGALWKSIMIENARVYDTARDFARVVIAIDPAGTHNKTSDDTGICVAAKGQDGHFYVLHGLGYSLSPNGWATKAIELFHKYRADILIAERNNGGEMVEHTIRSVWQEAPLKTISATRGKIVRAEPISALYEQGKVHHVGMHVELEEQMCEFPVVNEHDDMVDSLVYALTELEESLSPVGASSEREESRTFGEHKLGLNKLRFWR